jgi:hypothetical protein
MTPEQARVRADLIAKYGERIFTQALEMSGVRCCLQALACAVLTNEERETVYQRAAMHLARLHATFMNTEESAIFTECAKRIDSAVDLWTLDDIEAREGLPPAP